MYARRHLQFFFFQSAASFASIYSTNSPIPGEISFR